MPINHWPTSERPREKLLKLGSGALSNAELLAILIRTGTPGRTALDVARELLTTFDSLSGLFQASRKDFKPVKGIGDSKFATLQAIQELARRSLLESIQQKDNLTSPKATRQYLCTVLANCQRETFWALFLNNQHQVIASEALAHGTLASANIYPREVVRVCLKHNAAAVIFAHNHPSGSLVVSEADKVITRTLQKALSVIDSRVLDHIIVGHNTCISMAELGLI